MRKREEGAKANKRSKYKLVAYGIRHPSGTHTYESSHLLAAIDRFASRVAPAQP